MSAVGHNSDTTAAGKLRAFIERIERLEEERKTLADHIAEVYAELASDGYDKQAAKTILKIRKAADGLETWTVRSAIVDSYLAALGMLPETGTVVATHVHVHEETDAAKTLPGVASLGRPATENGSDQEPAIDGSGGVPVQVVTHSATIPEPFEPPAFLQKKVVLRPNCLNPDLCASGTRDHCHRCKTAMAKSEAA